LALSEKEFFSHDIWTSLPMSSRGIGALKPRLSAVLREQIILEFPKLIRELEVGIDECRNQLTKLGDARTTVAKQRVYLMRISQLFSSLVRAALEGVYIYDFFGDAMTAAGCSRRLRAAIQNILLGLAKDMRCEGREQEIIEEPVEREDPRFAKQISRLDYMHHVQEVMKRSRGRELPGPINALIVGDLFYQ